MLAVAGADQTHHVVLAWAYVAFRVAHSLVQVTTNRVAWRFAFFVAASLTLAVLVVHAALVVF